MNFLEYQVELVKAFVELVKALAWPVTVGAVLFLFSDSITELLGRIKKGAWGDKSVEFTDLAVNEVSAELQQSKGELDAAKVREIDRGGLDEAVQDPAGTVDRAWRGVERALADLAQRRAPANDQFDNLMPDSFPDSLHLLIHAGVLPHRAGRAIRDLNAIRTKMLLFRERPGPTAVVSYVAVAGKLIDELNRLARDPAAVYSHPSD